MDSEDLNNAINILEMAIKKGIFEEPKNDKKLEKLLKNISKVRKNNKNMLPNTSSINTSSINTPSINTPSENNKIVHLTESTLTPTMSETSIATITANSDTISMSNNQAPSEMFVCQSDESDVTLTQYNLALTNYSNNSDDENSDQIIRLK